MVVNAFTKKEYIYSNNEVNLINFKTPAGEVTILDNHVNYVSQILPGTIKITSVKDNLEKEILKGFISIKDNIANIILEEESPSQLEKKDLNAEAITNAVEFISEKSKNDNLDYTYLLGALEKELFNLRKSISK